TVADKQDRSAAVRETAHLAKAFFLEGSIPDCEHLVDNQYLWLEMRSYGKRQANIHARGIPLHRRVQKLLDLAEGDDLIELTPNLRSGHSQNGAVQEDILPPGQLLMKAGAHLKQATHSAVQANSHLGRNRNAAQQLEHGALTGAVPADDADDFARFNLQRNAPERPE